MSKPQKIRVLSRTTVEGQNEISYCPFCRQKNARGFVGGVIESSCAHLNGWTKVGITGSPRAIFMGFESELNT